MTSPKQATHLGQAWGLIQAARGTGPADEFVLAALIDAEVELEALPDIGPIPIPTPPGRAHAAHDLAGLIHEALTHLEKAGPQAASEAAAFLRDALRQVGP